MSAYLLPLLFTAFVWWFATGAILVLDRLPLRTFPWSFTAATGGAASALYGLAVTRTDATPAGAYCGFACAVAVWGWIEMSFLMGFITGPRRHACPADCRGWQHFGHGVGAVLYHELAIVLLSIAVLGLTWGGPNQVGAWAFVILWGMRESAKLNLFLGVANLGENFLPAHLRYLSSFFRRRAMNPLLPLSVTVGTVLAVIEVGQAIDPVTDSFGRTEATLLATLLGLGVIEHWALVIPIRIDALWHLREPESRADAVCDLRPAVPIRGRVDQVV